MFNKQISHCKGRWGGWSSPPAPCPHRPPPPWCLVHATDQVARTAWERPSAADPDLCPQGQCLQPQLLHCLRGHPQEAAQQREMFRLLPDLSATESLEEPGHLFTSRGYSALLDGSPQQACPLPAGSLEPRAWPLCPPLQPQPMARDTETGLVAWLGASWLLKSLVPLFSF